MARVLRLDVLTRDYFYVTKFGDVTPINDTSLSFTDVIRDFIPKIIVEKILWFPYIVNKKFILNVPWRFKLLSLNISLYNHSENRPCYFLISDPLFLLSV